MTNLQKHKGSYYFELLTTEEQSQFRTNVLAHGELEMDEIFNSEFGSFKRFVGSCFSFEDSPEGKDYWKLICDSERDGVSDEDSERDFILDLIKMMVVAKAKESVLGNHSAKELLDKLEPEHFDEWQKEFRKNRAEEEESFYRIKYRSLPSLLMSSFRFKDAEKGGEYWSNLCDYYSAKEATDDLINDLGLTKEDESN